MNSTSDALMTLDEYKQSLLTSIHIGITASNNDDAYSVGLRNGLRICKAYIDGQEPEYEEVKNDPLTWSELRAMKGKPVWMEYNLHLSERAQAVSKGWFVISSFRPLGQAAEMMVMTNNFVFTDYEQVGEWQAYRKERI